MHQLPTFLQILNSPIPERAKERERKVDKSRRELRPKLERWETKCSDGRSCQWRGSSYHTNHHNRTIEDAPHPWSFWSYWYRNLFFLCTSKTQSWVRLMSFFLFIMVIEKLFLLMTIFDFLEVFLVYILFVIPLLWFESEKMISFVNLNGSTESTRKLHWDNRV